MDRRRACGACDALCGALATLGPRRGGARVRSFAVAAEPLEVLTSAYLNFKDANFGVPSANVGTSALVETKAISHTR